MPVEINGKLFSVAEAARKLKLSPGTVRQYINRGLLEPVRVGGSVLFTECELDRYNEERWPRGKNKPRTEGEVA